VAFRTAHAMVGEAVRNAVMHDSTRLAEYGPPGWLDGIDMPADLPALVRAHASGGGPGAFGAAFDAAAGEWTAHRRWHQDWRRACEDAAAQLDRAVEELDG
jgi:argininosuccinate lyase